MLGNHLSPPLACDPLSSAYLFFWHCPTPPPKGLDDLCNDDRIVQWTLSTSMYTVSIDSSGNFFFSVVHTFPYTHTSCGFCFIHHHGRSHDEGGRTKHNLPCERWWVVGCLGIWSARFVLLCSGLQQATIFVTDVRGRVTQPPLDINVASAVEYLFFFSLLSLSTSL